jgi:AraC-like DNA-binding protein
VCEFLRAHHLYEINRDVVADRFGISPSHLSRLFQRQGHGGFSHFLAQVRVEHAKILLREAGLRVDDVAVRCGFRDAAYFCRVFKGLAKVSPGKYRSEAK